MIGWAYAKSDVPYFQDRGAWMLRFYSDLIDDLMMQVLISNDE